MESSHVYGGSEECHSNESGWTMYIGDSYEEEEDNLNTTTNNNNVNGDSYEEEEENSNDDDDNNDTDDSMASDASSGPSHWWANGKIYSKNDKDSVMMMRGKNGYSEKSCSSVPKYKATKNSSSSVKKKKKNEGGVEEKEESVHSAKGAQKAAEKSHKERRNYFWKGKTGK